MIRKTLDRITQTLFGFGVAGTTVASAQTADLGDDVITFGSNGRANTEMIAAGTASSEETGDSVASADGSLIRLFEQTDQGYRVVGDIETLAQAPYIAASGPTISAVDGLNIFDYTVTFGEQDGQRTIDNVTRNEGLRLQTPVSDLAGYGRDAVNHFILDGKTLRIYDQTGEQVQEHNLESAGIQGNLRGVGRDEANNRVYIGSASGELHTLFLNDDFSSITQKTTTQTDLGALAGVGYSGGNLAVNVNEGALLSLGIQTQEWSADLISTVRIATLPRIPTSSIEFGTRFNSSRADDANDSLVQVSTGDDNVVNPLPEDVYAVFRTDFQSRALVNYFGVNDPTTYLGELLSVRGLGVSPSMRIEAKTDNAPTHYLLNFFDNQRVEGDLTPYHTEKNHVASAVVSAGEEVAVPENARLFMLTPLKGYSPFSAPVKEGERYVTSFSVSHNGDLPGSPDFGIPDYHIPIKIALREGSLSAAKDTHRVSGGSGTPFKVALPDANQAYVHLDGGNTN